MKLIISLIAPLLLLPGCMRVSITKEFNDLKRISENRLDHTIFWYDRDPCSNEEIRLTMQKGLSREEAIGIALANNPSLSARFNDLGIAKADLVQAGLFQNPQLTAIFRDPRIEGLCNNTEIEATMALTDFWQVPLRKKVAYEQLEATSLAIFNDILSIAYETIKTYNDALFGLHKEMLAESALKETTKLRDSIYHRQQYGFSTDLDTNMADVLVGQAATDLVQARNNRSNAVLALQKFLGINPLSNQELLFEDTLTILFDVPDKEILVEYAVSHHPKIAVAKARVEQYENLIALERAKTIQTLDFGIDIEKPEKCTDPTLLGPTFTLGVPIFDYNQAQKARAKFLYEQAVKNLEAEIIHLKEMIRSTYSNVEAAKKQIVIYQNDILPAGQKALEYTLHYNKQMQITMPTIYQTYLSILDIRQHYLISQKEYLNNYAQLEQLVSKKLSEF